jgi:hypothetical protein
MASTSSLVAKRPLMRGRTSAYALRDAYLWFFGGLRQGLQQQAAGQACQ